MMKRPYPHNTDIKNAILEVLARDPLVKPDEFVERVKKQLEEKGFYAGLVTPKRVWSVYEKAVREGDLFDYLGVVQRAEEEQGEKSF